MVLVTQHKARPSVHHKKRVGQHQKQTKSFKKTYWPYLPIALIIGVGVLANTIWASHQRSVLGYTTNVGPTGLLASTNAIRGQNHEASLANNFALTRAAQSKANDMVKQNYWSHTSPNGEQPWQFIQAAGYQYSVAGENLAYGFDSSDATLTAWMNSTEHRANVLNTSYTQVGFGVAKAYNFMGHGPQTVVVAMYAAPGTSTNAGAVLGAHTTASISRLQLMTGTGALTIAGLSLLMGVCIGAVIIRHSLFWHKALVRGEEFVVRHHALDLVLVSVGAVAFLVTRHVGSIL
jgi:hypothetical protein